MKSWIDAFTIAVVEANSKGIEKLIFSMPEFQSKEEMRQASALIQEALLIIKNEKEETWATMQKIKKTRNFLTGSITSHQCEYRG
ncbi:MAG: hypothetical protein EOL93_09685 [Epsilonproteobacteria bacterium]|nr:hypothetical protein [Campylobacterota bacterium]